MKAIFVLILFVLLAAFGFEAAEAGVRRGSTDTWEKQVALDEEWGEQQARNATLNGTLDAEDEHEDFDEDDDDEDFDEDAERIDFDDIEQMDEHSAGRTIHRRSIVKNFIIFAFAAILQFEVFVLAALIQNNSELDSMIERLERDLEELIRRRNLMDET